MIVAPALAVRTGLRALFNAFRGDAFTGDAGTIGAEMPGIEVIGEATTLVETKVPTETDVLVVAVDSPGQVELDETLQALPSVAVLWLAQGPGQAAKILLGLPARAWGILPLDSTAEELVAAVQALAEGLVVGSPALLKPLLARSRPDGEPDEEALIEPLTDRETQVLQLLAHGLANKQMALNLGISEHTVKFHVSSIYAKLGAANRTEAVRVGVQKGLVVL
jgi:DNA-binding NarL/FixJ family response regulator